MIIIVEKIEGINMYKKYDVYRFIVNDTRDSLDHLSACERDLVDYYQSHIDAIKKSNDADRDEKVQNYLYKTSDIHNLMKENSEILHQIQNNIQQLENNINQIENLEQNPKKRETLSIKEEPKKVEEPKEDNFDVMVAKANKIKEVGLVHYNNLKKIAREANELLANITTSKEYSVKSIFDTECKHLYHLATDMGELLDGIKLGNNDGSSVIDMIRKAINEEVERSEYISSEAYKIICMGSDEAINTNALEMFCGLVRNEYSKILEKINDIDNMAIEVNADNNSEESKIAVGLLQEIIDEEGRKIRSSLIKLEKLIDRPSLNTMDKKIIDFGEIKINDDDDEMTKKIKQVLNYAKNNERDYKKIYNKLISILNVDNSEERLSLPTVYPESEKDKDTKEYKNIIDLQNKSFWEARSIASNEGIKYPSAEYEKRVREYQNEWLIRNHDMSLEEIYDKIEDFEKKYAEDIYVKKVYNRALKKLREESNKSISELCDESLGLSLLDKKAYEILENDLLQVIRDISQTKKVEEVTSSIAVADYRKNMKLDQLIERKEMIEREMYILRKRAERIEAELG